MFTYSGCLKFKYGLIIMSRNRKLIESSGEITEEKHPGKAVINRRQQLMEVSTRLFSQKGFKGTTIKEIALAAGINEALIFRHFKDKNELYSAILAHKANKASTDQWVAEMRKFADQRDDEGLFNLLAAKIGEHYHNDPDFLRLLLYSTLEGHELAQLFYEEQARHTYQFLREYIVLRQREGVFVECHPDTVVRAFISMPSHHALASILFSHSVLKISQPEAISTFVRLFLNGLLRTPAAKATASKASQATNKKRQR